MKKVLTTLLLLVSVAGICPAAAAAASEPLTRTPAASATNGSLNSFALQRNRRWRRRAVWRIRSNRGRTDNTWNRGRWNNRRRWDDRRWNRGRRDNNWNRGRRNRGGHGRH